MSISLNPSNTLDFTRPLTTLATRSLTITNNDAQTIAFKIKTTAPKLYCASPNSGRVEPGESIDVSVMLQALKEEPPLDTKCKDKFLILSTIVTPDKENLALHDIWASPESQEEGKVLRQKLRVAYLTADSQTLEEDDEDADETASNVTVDESPVHEPTAAEQEKISVSLNPSSALGFNRPLTNFARRFLTIKNNNSQPIAFKIMTTAPKLYCVHPNPGRVEARGSINVLFMLQGLKEEPPLDTECKDKFVILSTIITPDKKKLALQDICANLEKDERGNVLRQELGVTYLPDEDWYSVVLYWQNRMSSNSIANEPLPVNGNIFAKDDHRYFMAPAPPEEIAYDEQRTQLPPPEAAHPEAHTPVPAAPALEPIDITRQKSIYEEMVAKYHKGQAETERLKAENERLMAEFESLTAQLKRLRT